MSGPDFWPKSYAKPAEDAASVPAIDNTVKLGRMMPDGSIEYTGTEPAFPTEEERKAKDRSTGHIAESRPRVRVQNVDWDEIWPSIEQRMRDNPSVDAQTLAQYYGVPYLDLHIRMQEWKKANVKEDDVLTEKRTMTKYTQEERLEMARQIKDLLASGDSKYGAALRLGIAPGNADRWLKELAKVESDEFDKQTMGMIHDAILESVDEGKREPNVHEETVVITSNLTQDDIDNMISHLPSVSAEPEQKVEEVYHLAGPDYVSPLKRYIPADTTLDEMKVEWCQDALGLRIPPGQRLAIIQQIAAIGG